DLKAIGEPDAIFFALPTPPNGDGEADLSFVLQATEQVAKIIKKYTVLVNKSTVPIGTTQKVRALAAKHIKVPFDVVSNPEFLREGLAVDDFMRPDRIVVGTTSKAAAKIMEEIYQPFTVEGAQLFVMDEASSELTKYAANSFLALKISFMNEIANLCERVGANVETVRVGIGADERIGSRFLHAGIGYGGSCFPKDVMALEKIALAHDYDFKLVSAVMDVNARQKLTLVKKIVAHYGEDLSQKTFAVWGLAFKPDTDDIREAPALEIIRELLNRGAALQVFDPEAMDNVQQLIGDTVQYAKTAKEALAGADALVICTEWKEFASVEPAFLVKQLGDKVVFDGRNIFSLESVAAAHLTYISVGRKEVGRA
ncbi:MAG TPA: UDP-glucose/GDP-mannose dehydrogenase family protein, partial [Candidatus Saccharimonadales bacterium]|nr:UDP-glucose/GDP-mannose dehydrogenase family protein [Candidatus Saccharimonadales bacterium]